MKRKKPEKPTLYNIFFSTSAVNNGTTTYWNANAHQHHIESDFIKIENEMLFFFVASPKLITIDISMDYGFMLRSCWITQKKTEEKLNHNRRKKFVSVVVDISCFQGFIIYQFVKLGWKMIKTIKRRCSRNRNSFWEISFFVFLSKH